MFNCSSTSGRQQCSDHGYYCDDILRQICICDKDYWTSDANNKELGCDVHILSEFILDYAIVAICSASILIILRFFIVRFSTEKFYKYSFELMFIIGIIFDLTIAIENIRACEKVIGNTPSNLYGPYFVFFFQSGLILYFFVILKFLKSCKGFVSENYNHEGKGFDAMIYRLASLAYWFPPASFGVCALSLIGPLTKYQNFFIKVFIIGSGFLALTSGLMITYAFRFVLKYLEDHILNFDQTANEIQTVYARLKRDYYVSGTVSVIVGIACVSFGSSNYLWTRSHHLFTCVKLILPLVAFVPIMSKSRFVKREFGSAEVHCGVWEDSNTGDVATPDVSRESLAMQEIKLKPQSNLRK
mmetsp:Transcript_13287/g.12875  ORF Transcript_13287/g.12875 Transcript_13287/m.12875 type:complete len:357 (+) Transcript_13287:253-1323(+)